MSPGAVARALGKTRTAAEFRSPLVVQAPRRHAPRTSWGLDAIRQARDEQLRGRFDLPVRLAEAMRTDDALYVPYQNRVAPQSALTPTFKPHESERGRALQKKAIDAISIPKSVLKGAAGTLANHGIAILRSKHEPSEDGTIIGFRVDEWPLEHVYWDDSREELMTRVHAGAPVPIVHGDGVWTVVRKVHDRPWAHEAAVLPGGFIWAAHANGISDWAGGSQAHGNSKVVGEMPEGVAIQKDGASEPTLTPQALGFLRTITEIASGEATAGLIPHGAKADFISNGSSAWQIFENLVVNREKSAARVYLGTDAILGSVGGAPGIDISALFMVATTTIQGDLDAFEQAINTGVLQPWAAMHDGTSRLAPTFSYGYPDIDATRKSEERDANMKRLLERVADLRAQQFEVTQETVDRLAREFNVDPAPRLAQAENRSTPLPLAPTDIARVTRVKEARASLGLPALGDERDNLFMSELEALAKAKADAQAAEAEAAADAEAQIKVDEAAAEDAPAETPPPEPPPAA